MKKYVSHLLLHLVIVLIVSGLSSARGAVSAPEDLILARVNEEDITLEYLQMLFSRRHQGHTGMLATEDLLKDFVNRVIDEKLLLQEARRLGIDRNILESPEYLNFRKRLLKEELYREEILEKAVITDEMVKDAYKKLDILYHGEIITVASEQEALEIHRKLREGESFEDLARKHSLHKTAKYGGDLGFIALGILDEKAEKVLFALQEKEFSRPFGSEEGFAILFLREKKSSTPPEYERVSDNLRAILKRRKVAESKEEFYGRLHAQRKLVIHEGLLKKEEFLKAAAEENRKQYEKTPVATFQGGELLFGDLIKEEEVDIGKIASQSSFQAEKSLRHLLENRLDDLFLDRMIQERELTPEAARGLQILKERFMMEDLYNNYIMKEIRVSDSEVEAYYGEKGKEFEVPESVKLRMISSKAKEKMEEAKKKLLAGEEFAAVAAELSEDRFLASRGGDMGWVRKGQAPGSLDEKIFSMAPGEVTEIMELPEGFGIIKVEEKKDKLLPPVGDVKEKVKTQLMKWKGGQEREKWVSKLKKEARIKVYEKKIKKAMDLLNEGFGEKMGKAVSGKENKKPMESEAKGDHAKSKRQEQ